MVHLLTKTAEKVDKVADEDKADRGHVQKNCSVVLALPNVAVLPDGKDYWWQNFAALFDDNVLTMGRVDKKEPMSTCQGCDCDTN